MEMQIAEDDGYLTGLSCSYQCSYKCSGIAHIVNMLMAFRRTGSWYKKEANQCFPPFSYFCNFTCHKAKSETIQASLIKVTQLTKIWLTSCKVFQCKQAYHSPKNPDISINDNDPEKNCPLHNKPHPRKQCRTFGKKPLEPFSRENTHFQVLCFNIPPYQGLCLFMS